MRNTKCPFCPKMFTDKHRFCNHIRMKHNDQVPTDCEPLEWAYSLLVGKPVGRVCVQCRKNPVHFNQDTLKYERLCDDPACKEAYVKMVKDRMVHVYGKEHLLNEADMQRRMIFNHKQARDFVWDDKHKFRIIGSYEEDFLNHLKSLDWSPNDVICPSPNNYWYKWKNTGSSDKTNIPLGAAVITDGDPAINDNYGHIGIYIGNGMVASNIGGVKIESVESFANGKYGPWLGWCWPDGKVLQPEVTADTSGWKVGTASAYGAAAGDAYIADNLGTATGEAVTATSMGVAIPMAWSNFRSYFGKTVMIEYNGKVVTAKRNDCGGMGNGSRALDLQPGVIRAFGFTSCDDWGLRQVKYKIL